MLWHAQTLLREYRGDGHIAAMVVEGVDGCEALVIHGATGEVPAEVLQVEPVRPDEDWSAAEARLRDRGWLDADGALTDAGRAHRQWVEDRTEAGRRPLAAPRRRGLHPPARARPPAVKAIVGLRHLRLPPRPSSLNAEPVPPATPVRR